jgi:hypothetical protein
MSIDLGNAPTGTPPSSAEKLQIQNILSILSSSTQNYVMAKADGNAVANGTALRAAYTTAKALTPNGAARSATNRAVLIVSPGVYDLVTTPLTLDTQHLDVIGLSPEAKDTLIKSQVIASNSGTLVVTVPGPNVRNLYIQNTGTGAMTGASTNPAAFVPYSGAGADNYFYNCIFEGVNSTVYSTRVAARFVGNYEKCRVIGSCGFGYGTVCGGTYKDCTAGGDSFGGGPGGEAGGVYINCVAGDTSFGGLTASGTFVNCAAGSDSFGGDVVNGLASGTFTDCTAGTYSFGYVTASGTFIRCTAGGHCFGGSGSGTATGTFTDCTSTGDYAFGGHTAGDGIYTRCSSGGYSFGFVVSSGNFNQCQAGNQSFGGADNALALGAYTDCTAGDLSFGHATAWGPGGTFTNCTAGIDSFGGGEDAIATGTYVRCTGGAGSFGGISGGFSGTCYYCHITDTSVFPSTPSGGFPGKLFFCVNGDGSIIDRLDHAED